MSEHRYHQAIKLMLDELASAGGDAAGVALFRFGGAIQFGTGAATCRRTYDGLVGDFVDALACAIARHRKLPHPESYDVRKAQTAEILKEFVAKGAQAKEAA